MSAVLKAFNTPRRREILRLTWDVEKAAGALHGSMPDITFGAVSQHLRVLTDAGLVSVREDGRQRFYRARKDALGPLRGWLESMWKDALYALKVQAELEEARRGPRSTRARRHKR